MIELRRASAGSGKTYTLTKTFISLYIGKDTSMGRRLRNREELAEALGHILGVTFTNKATNEMKARIVNSLDALSHPHSGREIAYQADFMEEFGVGAEELADTCRYALSELLHNYSDFRIATIDSFFQSVLRSFTYETDINQNYQVEIDDNYLLSIGVNDMLSQIKEQSKKGNDIRHILNRYIGASMDKGKSWNVFNKNADSKSLYGTIMGFAQELTKESFGDKEEKALHKFYDEYPDFRLYMSELTQAYDDFLLEKYKAVLDAWQPLGQAFESAELDISEVANSSIKNFYTKFILSHNHLDSDNIPKSPSANQQSGVFKSANKSLQKQYDWDELLPPIAEAYEEWRINATLWGIYRKRLLLIGMVRPIMQAVADFREENNIVQLSDTNSIINKIIEDTDVPFIYEKTGYYLHNYLIDEFQDTSKLQWTNLLPLLQESVAYNRHNLIIGDAKQSIYRFRNADSSLITTQVKKDFGSNCFETGNTAAENANHRSSPEIIQFNNTLYATLPSNLDLANRSTLANLYSSSTQDIPHKEEADRKHGYVRVILPKFNDKDDKDVASAINADIIQELLHRGYRQQDITVLVRTNKQGTAFIETLLQHNIQCSETEGYIPMSFISEESLLIDSSFAVRLVVSALGRMLLSANLSTGSDDKGNIENPEEDNQSNGDNTGIEYIDPADFERQLRNYQSRNPDISASDALEVILAGGSSEDTDSMSQGMRPLPSLVEWIIARQLPQDIREEHACFLAAFQDIVLDYCENNPTDIGSFLKWWDNNKGKFNVQSADNTDAILVMTIHKAKGLDATCVLLPFAGSTLSNLPESAWLRPVVPDSIKSKYSLPEYLPINLSLGELEGTPHENAAISSTEAKTTDELNTLYVGTTRAVRELYMTVGVKESKSKNKNDSSSLTNILRNILATPTPPHTNIAPDLAVDSKLWHFTPSDEGHEFDTLEYGDISKVIPSVPPGDNDEDKYIGDYTANPDFKIIFHNRANTDTGEPDC